VGCENDNDCKGGGRCTIASCHNSECSYKLDPDCVQENEGGHGGLRGDGFGGSVIVPIPVPVVPAPAVVPAPELVSPISNNPDDNRPDLANPGRGSLAGELKYDDHESTKDSGTRLSCATLGTDIKDLWMWVVILAAIYVISRRKRANQQQ